MHSKEQRNHTSLHCCKNKEAGKKLLKNSHGYTQCKHLLILIFGGVVWNNLIEAKEEKKVS